MSQQIKPSNGSYFTSRDFERDVTPEIAAILDECVAGFLDGTIRIGKASYQKGYANPDCFLTSAGAVLTKSVLEYYLQKLSRAGFNYDKAHDFCEMFRKRFGWNEMYYTIQLWFNKFVRNRYFYDTNAEENDKRRAAGKIVWGRDENFVLKQDADTSALSQDVVQFSCYFALGYMKYGQSFDNLNAEEIFNYLTALGSDEPAKMKKYGSGTLPKEVTEYKDSAVSCKANDAFATVKITLKEESEGHYAKALDFLISLLEMEFPRSYSLDFRSPNKHYLPIKKLPKKGVNQLFANAIEYHALHGKIEQYARLVMKEFEWYNNLNEENCAMPGTFAVFALGLLDEAYHSLAVDYIKICDGEHQGVHGEFVLAYIEKYGFTEKGLELYTLCEQNIQELPKKLVALHKKMK